MKDGGPAFPAYIPGKSEQVFTDGQRGVAYRAEIAADGMSLRDYFAAAALHSIGLMLTDASSNAVAPKIAELAYQLADAMLKARE